MLIIVTKENNLEWNVQFRNVYLEIPKWKNTDMRATVESEEGKCLKLLHVWTDREGQLYGVPLELSFNNSFLSSRFNWNHQTH